MQTLSVLTVEDGAIIVATPTGERFRLPIDAALRSRLVNTGSAPDEKRLSPREIQAHIRAGLTAEQVAAMTGVPVASIERFVGPVLAERSYIVESALAVRLPPETEGARSRTFGAVMGERLDALAAKEVRWTSAKEPSGWVLAVAFVADDLQHHARWRFDHKHMGLSPDNVEASTLSQQGVPAALTPRLRAIEPTAPVTIVPQPQSAVREERPAAPHGARVAPAEPDRTRFDSAAFRFPPLREEPPAATPPGRGAPPSDAPARSGPVEPAASATGPVSSRTAPQPAAPKPAPPADRRPSVTDPSGTDRLAQLSRRRGEREPAPQHTEDDETPTRAMDAIPTGEVFAPRPTTERRESASIHRLPVRAQPPADASAAERPAEPTRRRRERGGLTPVEQLLQERAELQAAAEAEAAAGSPPADPAESAAPAVRPRRGRTSMPSWDEIVFGRDEP